MEQEMTIRAIMLIISLVSLGVMLMTDKTTRRRMGKIFNRENKQTGKIKERP